MGNDELAKKCRLCLHFFPTFSEVKAKPTLPQFRLRKATKVYDFVLLVKVELRAKRVQKTNSDPLSSESKSMI